jgi:ABC-type nitrate/sulfonate/bicarbonate transport system substrate-binding protein
VTGSFHSHAIRSSFPTQTPSGAAMLARSPPRSSPTARTNILDELKRELKTCSKAGVFPMALMQTLRRFLTTASIADGMGLLSPLPALAADAPLETIKLRLTKLPTICVAPQYAAEELLHSEGFAEVEYVDVGTGAAAIEAIGRGEVDFGINFAATQVTALDANQPITLLCGVHVGCFELFGRKGIDSVAQLAGRKVAVPESRSSSQSFLSATAAHVGLDPIKDIRWLPSPSAVELFRERGGRRLPWHPACDARASRRRNP